MITLDSSIKLIALQFNFSNPNIIPRSIKILDQEQNQKGAAQKPATGKIRIEPAQNVCLEYFLGELSQFGYEMVDAFCRVRANGYGKPCFYSVRFIFARSENAQITEEFRKPRKRLYLELYRLCKEALWQVKAFYNPFFENRKEIAGQHVVNIVAQNRQPLFQPDGSPVLTSKQEGTVKLQIPIKANHYLQIKDNLIQIVQC